MVYNNFNIFHQPINTLHSDTDTPNRVFDIMEKLEEYSYFDLSQELRNNNQICSLCDEVFMDNERVKIFSCNQHIFHLNCIKDFIKNKIDSVKCPLCNQSLNVNDINGPSLSLNIDAPPLNPRNYSRRDDLNIERRHQINLSNSRNNGEVVNNRLNNFHNLHFSGRIRNLLQQLGEIRLHLNNTKKGLNKDILDNMEIAKIKDVDKLDVDKKKCTICLENYVNGDETIALPCIHIFHANCIKTWLKENNSCPICKNEIKFENQEFNENGEL